MLTEAERSVIARLWARKLEQDSRGLPHAERHRNLEPDSAEVISALASGLGVRRMLEIGGSSGISTIALAAAARRTKGKVTSLEIEPKRQEEARETIRSLGLSEYVSFIRDDAAKVMATLGEMEFVLLDCEKEDYIRFFDKLPLSPRAIVVADNILSHDMVDYVAHVRNLPGSESITLPVGKGLEVTRLR